MTPGSFAPPTPTVITWPRSSSTAYAEGRLTRDEHNERTQVS